MLGHKHVPYAWRLEDMFIVNTGTVSTLRLGQHAVYNVIEVDGEHVEVRRRHPYHGEELMIRFSTQTLDYVKSTEEIEEEVGAP